MPEARLDGERHAGCERQHHGVQRAVDMDESPVCTEARRVEAGGHGRDIVMRALHRGAAGQRQITGLPSSASSALAKESMSMAPLLSQSTAMASVRRMRAALGIE